MANRVGHPGHLPTELPVGTKVRDWQIRQLLGTGGFGRVYRVRDTRGENRVLKVAGVDPTSNRRLSDEAEIMLSYGEHVGLPRLHASWEDTRHAYLVMDYVEGETLESLCHRLGRPLSERRVLEVMWDTLDILRYLHGLEEPIVHLDIKTTQLLVNKDDNRLTLIDFGMAHRLHRGLVELPWGFGSRGYTAPEQYVPHRTVVDVRSDVYSVGVTAHRLLTGKQPINLGPVSWTGLRGKISPTLLAALERATAWHPAHRFPSVKQFMEAVYEEA